MFGHIGKLCVSVKLTPNPSLTGNVETEVLLGLWEGGVMDGPSHLSKGGKVEIGCWVCKNGGETPRRSTWGSAAYDICLPCDVLIPVGEPIAIPLKVSVKLPLHHHCKIILRSSLAKRGVFMPGGFGLIDEDFYPGEIHAIVSSLSLPVELKKGDRIVQALIEEHKFVANDLPVNSQRVGGFGSTGK